jgi:hypothetical protein
MQGNRGVDLDGKSDVLCGKLPGLFRRADDVDESFARDEARQVRPRSTRVCSRPSWHVCSWPDCDIQESYWRVRSRA